jgi:CO/xanthine dehydrogenase FAD-binding subunit
MTEDVQTVESPRTLEEAYAILAERRDSVRIIAGGTDLMVLMNARSCDAVHFLNIWGLDELRGITDKGSELRIGALTTFAEIARSRIVLGHIPSLAEASRTIGAIQIQDRATIGGNVVNASPAGDSLPVLAAFEAEVEAGSERGTRRICFREFYRGYRRTALEPDEIVLALWIPKLGVGERDYFRKVGTRRAQAISKVVMASRMTVLSGTIASISIGVGSVAPTVIRTPQTELFLTGAALTNAVIENARRMIAREVEPITDFRSTENYRRAVTGNILAAFLKQLT